jgi:hypothetical protein
MRRLCAIGLLLDMGSQAMSAAGPLELSLSREALRLAREPAAESDWASWRPLYLLDPGSTIVITTAVATLSGTFVDADAAKISVSRNGIIEQVVAEDALVVSVLKRRGSAAAAAGGTIGGLWLGSFVGYGLAAGSSCYNGCGGAVFTLLTAMIAGPILGGYGAWRASSHLTEEVVYRRPPARP